MSVLQNRYAKDLHLLKIIKINDFVNIMDMQLHVPTFVFLLLTFNFPWPVPKVQNTMISS